jgi:hypothetical protein
MKTTPGAQRRFFGNAVKRSDPLGWSLTWRNRDLRGQKQGTAPAKHLPTPAHTPAHTCPHLPTPAYTCFKAL